MSHNKDLGKNKPEQTAKTISQKLQAAEEYLDSSQPEKTIEVLDTLKLSSAKRQQQYTSLVLRGFANLELDRMDEALTNLESASRFQPVNPAIRTALIVIYQRLDLPFHAWQCAEDLSRTRPEAEPGLVNALHSSLDNYRETWTEVAERFQLPLDRLRKAELENEKAQRNLHEGQFNQAIHHARHAANLAPNIIHIQNNLATTLFYAGKIDDAIQTIQTILQSDPDNLSTRCHLIQFYSLVADTEKTTQEIKKFYSSLHYDEILENPHTLEKIIIYLARAESDDLLWDIARQVTKRPTNFLAGDSWYVLGAAAANKQDLTTAEILLKKSIKDTLDIERSENDLKLVQSAQKMGENQITANTLTGRLPLSHYMEIVPPSVQQQIMDSIDAKTSSKAIISRIKRLFQKFPYMISFYQRVFLNVNDDQVRSIAIQSLIASQEPKAIQFLKDILSSKYGSTDLRTEILFKLGEADYIDKNDSFPLWDAKSQEWIEVSLTPLQITDSPIPQGKPEALELVEKSRIELSKTSQHSHANAIKYLQAAIQIDPQCAMALHNLGVLYIQSGNESEGEKLIRKSMEADPEYLFARVSLASLELSHNNAEACQTHLEKIFSASEIPQDVFVNSQLIKFDLALMNHEIDHAEQLIQSLSNLLPDHPEVSRRKDYLKLLEIPALFEARWLDNVKKYRVKQLRKPISRDEILAQCLDRTSREALTPALATWAYTTQARKAQLIERLVKAMTDEETFELVWKSHLSKKEKQAILWVIKNNGVQLWSEFIDRYGDDMEESPYWQYHTPETIPGRLRMMQFLAVGALDGQAVCLIPYELRAMLRKYSKDRL